MGFVCLAMESLGFLDALNSAPVPGIKIKKKKPKAVSPTSNKVGWKQFFFASFSSGESNKQKITYAFAIFLSHVRLKARPSHTRARRPSLLPPRLLHLTLLHMSPKT